MKEMLNEGNQVHNFISSSGSDFLTSNGSGSTTLQKSLPPPSPCLLAIVVPISLLSTVRFPNNLYLSVHSHM